LKFSTGISPDGSEILLWVPVSLRPSNVRFFSAFLRHK
jgi:hypothetical protein